MYPLWHYPPRSLGGRDYADRTCDSLSGGHSLVRSLRDSLGVAVLVVASLDNLMPRLTASRTYLSRTGKASAEPSPEWRKFQREAAEGGLQCSLQRGSCDPDSWGADGRRSSAGSPKRPEQQQTGGGVRLLLNFSHSTAADTNISPSTSTPTPAPHLFQQHHRLESAFLFHADHPDIFATRIS